MTVNIFDNRRKRPQCYLLYYKELNANGTFLAYGKTKPWNSPIRHPMKTILHNFLTTLKRFKLSSALNILGLSVAFASFMVIMMQVGFENSFDKDYDVDGKICRLEYSEDSIDYHIIFPRPAYEIIKDHLPPQVKASVLTDSNDQPYLQVVGPSGVPQIFNECISAATTGLTEVFGFEIVEGSLDDALRQQSKVIVPKSIASKFYGAESAVGRTFMNTTDSTWYEVVAVYRDFPSNSSFANDIYRGFDETGDNKDNWDHQSYQIYLLLDRNADANAIAQAISSKLKDGWWESTKFRIHALDELYYVRGIQFDRLPKGNKAVTSVLLLIAILIIGIAVVNFINFSTSLAPLRIKSINTQKVLGCTEGRLRISLIAESVGFCLISYAVALLLVYIADSEGASAWLSVPMSIGDNPDVVLRTLALAVVVGIVAGLYPSFYITSFPPALVLKGSFGLSPKGKAFRTALIGFQFVVSIALIIGALFLQLQNRYVRNYATGFDQEQVAMVELPTSVSEHPDAFSDELKSDPLIADVAFTVRLIGVSDRYGQWGGNNPTGEHVVLQVLHVSSNFIPVMGLDIVEGTDVDARAGNAGQIRLVLNEKAAARFGFKVGDVFVGMEIIGIMKDFNFSNLRNDIEPMGFRIYPTDESWLNYAYVKVTGDPHAAAEHIRNTIARFDPLFPAEVQFFDSIFDNVYRKERKTTRVITLFSILAVLISLSGVFGLVLFETQYRRKEIGVRKVFGATVGEVLTMFNRSFMAIVSVCFVIAVPLAYIGVSGWLDTFAYRTPLHWWVFALAFAAVSAVTMLTVTFQSWRAATDNPVNSIRSE